MLYDGQPDPHGLWDFAERAQVTCFGTSAGFLTACMKAGVEPGRDNDLSRVRSLGSTGSPLPVEGFEWVYEHVKRDVWLFSTSGGTDVCTAFVGGCPLLPVYAGELQARALGAAVQAFDPDGQPLIGEVGELVLTEPMPSMPLFFWNDPDGARYRESYFETYPGVWRHGDWIKVNERGGSVIYGRSDSTINRGGVRMGTSELYSAVEGVDAVLDSLVVDVPSEDASESTMWLFVVVEGELDAELEQTLRRRRARVLLAPPRAGPDRAGRGGAAHAVGQEARGADQEDPDGHRSGPGGQPRLAGEPRGARRLRHAGARAGRRLAELGVQAPQQLVAEARRPLERGRAAPTADRDRRVAARARGIAVARRGSTTPRRRSACESSAISSANRTSQGCERSVSSGPSRRVKPARQRAARRG